MRFGGLTPTGATFGLAMEVTCLVDDWYWNLGNLVTFFYSCLVYIFRNILWHLYLDEDITNLFDYYHVLNYYYGYNLLRYDAKTYYHILKYIIDKFCLFLGTTTVSQACLIADTLQAIIHASGLEVLVSVCIVLEIQCSDFALPVLILPLCQVIYLHYMPVLYLISSFVQSVPLSRKWYGITFKKNMVLFLCWICHLFYHIVILTGVAFWKVMLKSKKYEFVQKFFEKMQRKGVPPRAITYKGSVAVSFIWCIAFMHCRYIHWICYLTFQLCSWPSNICTQC